MALHDERTWKPFQASLWKPLQSSLAGRGPGDRQKRLKDIVKTAVRARVNLKVALWLWQYAGHVKPAVEDQLYDQLDEFLEG